MELEQLKQLLVKTLETLQVMENRVAALEQRAVPDGQLASQVAALDVSCNRHEEALTLLVTQWLPPIADKLKELRLQVENLPAGGEKSTAPKHKTSYSTWAMIMALKNSGKSPVTIGKELDLHPSTVRKYISWKEEVIEQKRVAEFPNGVPEEIAALVRDLEPAEDDQGDDAE